MHEDLADWQQAFVDFLNNGRAAFCQSLLRDCPYGFS